MWLDTAIYAAPFGEGSFDVEKMGALRWQRFLIRQLYWVALSRSWKLLWKYLSTGCLSFYLCFGIPDGCTPSWFCKSCRERSKDRLDGMRDVKNDILHMSNWNTRRVSLDVHKIHLSVGARIARGEESFVIPTGGAVRLPLSAIAKDADTRKYTAEAIGRCKKVPANNPEDEDSWINFERCVRKQVAQGDKSVLLFHLRQLSF